MSETAHIAPRPPGRPRISFRWTNLLFMHWPVAPEQVQSRLPGRLEVDTFDGRAWIGLVPFTMTHVRRRPMPPLPGVSRIHECNVRTYVTHKGRSGVYFFSLDASHGPTCAWAKRFWHLNYVHARIQTRHEGRRFAYDLQRAREPSITLHCEWWRGRRLKPRTPDSLDYFLIERYALFTPDRTGRILCGPIWHTPWPLREAELIELEDDLVHASRLPVNRTDQPILHHCDDLAAEAWPLEG